MSNIPFRKCIGCGEMKEKTSLLRIAKNKDGAIIVDETGKLPGRGAYLCKDLSCFQKAVKGKGLDRSFHKGVSSEVYQIVEAALQNECSR